MVNNNGPKKKKLPRITMELYNMRKESYEFVKWSRNGCGKIYVKY